MSRRRFVSSSAQLARNAACFAAGIALAAASLAEETVSPSVPAAIPASTPPPVAAPASLGEQITAAVRSVLERTGSAICRIEGTDEHGQLRGTGFFIDADGTLLTSYSVGGQCEDLAVTIGEEKYPATRRAADARSGLAVLKVEAGEPLPFLRFGKSAALAVGAPVIALGYPLDLPLSPSLGLVGGFQIRHHNRFFATRHIRANVAVQRGQGGSPVVNLDGDVVGVVISTVETGGGAFALPIEAANKLLRDVEEHGHFRQGWLGTDVRASEAREFGSSARVRYVRQDGPGYRGGLRAGDVLLEIGGRKITSPEDVLDASFYVAVEEPLKVLVARAGKQQELTLLPAEAPNGEVPTADLQAPAILGANGMGLGPER